MSLGSTDAVALYVGSNGSLALQTRAVQRVEVLPKSKVTTSRWTHITHKQKPSICMCFKLYSCCLLTGHDLALFIDGILSDTTMGISKIR